MTDGADVCAGLLTPAGTGAIAVIRIVGGRAPDIVGELFRPRGRTTQSSQEAGSVRLGNLIDVGETIDEVIVAEYSLPPSPALDLCCHGGVRVVERIMQALERRGAHVGDGSALPYPVWRTEDRLTEEIHEALIRARTDRGVRFLLWQHMHLGHRIAQAAGQCTSEPEVAAAFLEKLIARYAPARFLLEGATAAIVGPPNSGKSTLFNRLVGREAAVASPLAGTTRDWITANLDLHGVPVTLVDTAGDRAVDDPLELLAIRRGREQAAGANVLLYVFDVSRPGSQRNPAGGGLAPDGRTQGGPPVSLWVGNKLDLLPPGASPPQGSPHGPAPILVSAATGEGVPEVQQQILRVLGLVDWPDDAPSIFLPRHLALAKQALSELWDDPASAARSLGEVCWPKVAPAPTRGL